MKELSIEEKAKAYDEAFEKAKGIIKYYKECNRDEASIEDLETIFHELKENKDEKIREKIIATIHLYYGEPLEDEAKEMIAWLDKLGEKEPVKNIVETWKDMRLEVYQQASGNRHEPNYSDDTTKMFSLNDIDEIIEKISEQKDADMVEPKDYNAIDPHFGKPIDKVEPKFHEGEWVVWNDKYYKVNYNSCGYELIDQDGLHTSLEYGTVDENAHIFSISDAKDGDVLVDGNLPFIFKKIDTNKYTYAYCGISIDDGFRIESEGELGEWTWMQDIKPATKEQIGTLMKAMVDAGWEFDFEKKELKKVAQKLAEWSEGDELNLSQAIWVCHQNGYNGVENWLKSIKNRVQPKQQWSKEDEAHIDSLLKRLEGICKPGAAFISTRFAISEDKDWLESIKQRMGG